MMNKRLYAILLAATLTACGAFAQSEPDPAGNARMVRLEVRPGVRLPYFAQWRPDAVATLVMFSGGNGGMGRIDTATGWPNSGNFLIRTAHTFQADGPFNIVLVGRASDVHSLDYAARISEQHLNDNVAMLRDIKRHSPAPIWLIGTSRGTVSTTALVIHDPEHLVSGLVLTSSILDYKVQGAVPTQDLEKITVPTLVVHHEHDACKVCPPSNVAWVMRGLKNSPVKAKLIVSGGESEAKGDPCAAWHSHGFAGIEQQVVGSIAAWILNPKED